MMHLRLCRLGRYHRCHAGSSQNFGEVRALGMLCCVRPPLVSDWRWQLAGERALWYANMCIYRRSRRGDRDAAISAVVVDLNQGANGVE